MEIKNTVNAYLAMKAILAVAAGHEKTPLIHSVAIPGLGTGIGALPPSIAAKQMSIAYDEAVNQQGRYPDDFSDAQRRYIDLNPNAVLSS